MKLAPTSQGVEVETALAFAMAGDTDDIIGTSPVLKRVLDYAAIVADTDSTVLITGETGTGKSALHKKVTK
jgi:transcriptional regulator with GAF, ATPase, and Fis domain